MPADTPAAPRPPASPTRRDQILAAAFARFQRDGLEAVSMRTVAADVGMSPMGLYRHYADRDALIEAMVEACLAAFARALQRAPQRGTAAQRLRRLLRAYLEFALTERAMYDLLFRATRPSTDPFLDEYKAGGSVSFEMLRSAVSARLSAAGGEPRNSVDAAISIWAQAHGLVSLYLAGRFGGGEPLFRRFYLRSVERVIESVVRPQVSA